MNHAGQIAEMVIGRFKRTITQDKMVVSTRRVGSKDGLMGKATVEAATLFSP